MRLLCINYEYPPIGGGGSVVCKGLAENLVKLGYEIDVVTSGMKNLPPYEIVNSVKVHRVNCVRRFKHYASSPELLTQLLPSYRRAKELIRCNKFSLNHTHFVVPSGIVSYMLWKKTGLPYVITVHGSDIPGYNPDRFNIEHKIIRKFWKQVITSSQMIIAPSHFLAQLIRKHVNVPITVIPNGYDIPKSTNTNKKNHILLVTRMFKRKGVQYFLEAIADLETDWKIFIAGDGPYLPTLKAMAKEVKPSVTFLGFIKGKTLQDIYSSAKIFVFPSILENFPVVLLEAMAAGCAVITTNSDGCLEVIGDAGIKTDICNVAQLKEALKYLMDNNAETERLAMLGRDRVCQFSWPTISAKYDQAFNKYLNKSQERDIIFS